MVDIEAIQQRGYKYNAAECVSPGHPDVSADVISATVVGEHIDTIQVRKLQQKRSLHPTDIFLWQEK